MEGIFIYTRQLSVVLVKADLPFCVSYVQILGCTGSYI
jgi:hypothetical protein